MKLRRKCGNWRSESGFSYVELLVVLPMMFILGVAMLDLFGTGARDYRNFLGDWELMQQVRIPMEEIAHDVRYCHEIQREVMDSNSVNLLIRRCIKNSEGEYEQRYRFTKLSGDNGYWIKKNSQPIMGNTFLSKVRLTECFFEILSPYKVRVVIAGEHLKTGHTFRLDRVMYSYGIGLRQDNEETG